MANDCISSICRTVLDNIKDAEMQMDYAEGAKLRGHHDLAEAHYEEAHKRIMTAKEWYERGMHHHAQTGGGKHEPLTEALIEREREHYHHVMNRINKFRPED